MGFLRNITIAAATVLLTGAIGLGQAPAVKSDKKSGKNNKAVVIKGDTVPPKAPTSADPIGTPTPDGPDDGEAKEVEGDILPYYQNYLKEYRLGPSDQISIEVFGQCPDYCKTGITIPPNARISYPLIRDGVMVAGRTVEQVAAEITRKLNEYIIDPQVTVTLDKAVATRYSIMGHVAQPGVHVMERRVSVYEAVTSAGGVARDGDRKKVAIVRVSKDGKLERKILNLEDMENGRTALVYLQPGDQVFVPSKGFSIQKVFEILARAESLRYMIPGIGQLPIPQIPYFP